MASVVRSAVMRLVASGLLLAMFAGSASAEDSKDVSSQALAILKQRCYQCHGVENYEPGLDVLDHASLVVDRGPKKTRFLVPGKPDESKIWQVIEAGTMPQDGNVLPANEQAVIRQWIEAGAKFPVAGAAERPFQSEAAILTAIQNHLTSSPRNDRQFLRFLSITHLYNQRSAVTDQELRLARAALSKALNSMSRSAEIVVPKAIDGEAQTLFVIDLRKFDWTAAQWSKVVAAYPYGLRPGGVVESNLYEGIAEQYGTEFDGVTHIRGDWFSIFATRPPLYHEMLALPETLGELEKSLKVDRQRDFRENRMYRGGVQQSGVSSQNRVIDYHPSDRGAYWISYDFDRNSGRGNIARFPLGPKFEGNAFNDQAFEAAGSEIVFTMPNRMMGYFLVDGVGKRIDIGPIHIVNDQAKTSGTPEIVNGLSCIACHRHGLRDFTDVIGESHGLQNADARLKASQIYDNVELQTRVLQSRNEFMRANEAAVGPFLKVAEDAQRPIEQFPEPISAIARRYERDLTLEMVAAELGIQDPETLKANLKVVTLRGLGLGPLERGQTIKRSMWSARDAAKSPFQEAAQALSIGLPIQPLN